MKRLFINKLFSKFLSIILSIVIIFVSYGCQEEEPKVESFTITGPTSVVINQEIILSVDVIVTGNPEYEVNWRSEDEEIATVIDGSVKGISIGTVKIIVEIAGITNEYSIEVKNKVIMDKLIFNGVNLITSYPVAYEKVELVLSEANVGFIEDNFNPYDYNEIYVYGIFTSPSGEVIQMPAFWYRDYNITLDSSMATGGSISGMNSTQDGEPTGMERVVWLSDTYEYRLRFQPEEAGNWTYQIYVSIQGEINQYLNGNISVIENTDVTDYKGVVQVDTSNNRGFIYEDGTSYIPIGENLGWYTAADRKTYDYSVWMEQLYLNNMNCTRVWMAPWGFCLHWGKEYDNFDDRLNYAARLDKVIELANQYDIYMMLALVNHGQFSSTVNSTWSSNPYNSANGGIIDQPDYFFTNAEAKAAYKNELLYIIGRYGYSDNIMAWELFNEVNWTDNATMNAYYIKQWHKEMATFINNIDPYNHMITTSYNGETGSAYSLEEIDFVNPHNYGYSGKNYNSSLPQALEKIFSTYNKPVLHSEIGMNWESGTETAKDDPTGITLHQASWAGMMGGGAGGAMNWWWDSWVHPNNLYYQFKGAGAFGKLLDLTGEDYSQLRLNSQVEFPSTVGILGYKFDDRIYGYIYDVKWSYLTPNTSALKNIEITIPFASGNYTLSYYNTNTGEVISSQNITSNGSFKITLPEFTADIAFIIE